MASHPHSFVEKNLGLMLVFTLFACSLGGLAEIVPLMFQKETTTPVEGLKPFGALELEGRDVYIREGCNVCHTQMIRPFRAETERYGHYSVAGESVYDHPFLWGSRRIGPDLAREGGLKSNLWHLRHFENPREINPRSIMPAYPHFSTNDIDFPGIQKKIDAMLMLGVPYGDAINTAPDMARQQAREIAADLAATGGPSGLETKEVTAIIAYMQRLGKDIKAAPGVATTAKTGGQP